MNYFSRIAVSLGAIAAFILPLHYWVYLPIREHHNYQQYLKRRQAIEQYVRRMEYHCHIIFTPEKEYRCEKFNEAQESGNFQVSPLGKPVKK
ncbi:MULTISPECIES: hypothetical protein [Nostocaceae]|uniref:hypothetical protein n=1 Tax=Nostocaceae TaxID=1162 RepID=UPI001686BCF5|nr:MULTISPECIES: hypothetical protein [Nostocaceae]MBD2303235.1 hypothetical protein [Nostoc sp. FACHB-190]MBD2480067.1 hypothetical protein [Anabaena sp. FACHB-83]